MYNVLTKMREIETTQIGFQLEVLVKFRNSVDGMIDVCVHGLPSIHIEYNANGYKVLASDSTWIYCHNIEQIRMWVMQKLSDIRSSQSPLTRGEAC
jgi:hypothetical protein